LFVCLSFIICCLLLVNKVAYFQTINFVDGSKLVRNPNSNS